MTNQEAFDRVVTGLRKQGQRSANGLICRYRSSKGFRCSVGMLITDEFYDPAFENISIIVRHAARPILKSGDPFYQEKVDRFFEMLKKALPGVSLDLLEDLQNVHDTYNVEMWEGGFKIVALKYNLNMPPRINKTQENLSPEKELVLT
jgi:hypothetical protein